MKLVAVIIVLALFVQDNEAWRRPRRKSTFPSCHPRNCAVSVWSQWSSCPCGSSATRTRTRRIILPAACGGSCFFHRLESQLCKRDCQNSGTPTRNGCVCPPSYLGTCCEIAVPLTTKGEMRITATNRTSAPSPSATIPRSRLTPQEKLASVAPTSASTRTRQRAIRTQQLDPTVPTEQLTQSNATWRITATTPRTRSTAASSVIASTSVATRTRKTAIRTEQLDPTVSTEQLTKSNATWRITATTPRTRSTTASSALAPTSATTRTRQTAIRAEQLDPKVSTEQLSQSNATWRITPTTPRTRSTTASSAIASTSATTRTRQTAIRTEQLDPTVSTEQLTQSNATQRITATTPRTRSTATSSALAPKSATTRTRQTAIRMGQLDPTVSTEQLPQSNATWRITVTTPRTRSTTASSAIAPTSATTRTRQTAIRAEQLDPKVSAEQLPQSNATWRITPTTSGTRSKTASSAIASTSATTRTRQTAIRTEQLDPTVSTEQLTQSNATRRITATTPRTRSTATSSALAPTSATTRTRQTAIRTEQLDPTVSTEQLPQSNATWRITATTPRTGSTTASSAIAPTSATTRTRQTAITTEQLDKTVSTEQLPQSNATRRITATTPRPRSTAASSAIPPSPSSAFGGMNATEPPFTRCGGILNATSGTFATPGYPFSYFNNLNCLWTLRIPTDSVLRLRFERFNTEQCCDFVELTVTTGRLARLSGSRNGFSTTVRGDRSRVLHIRFTTDGSVVRPGFLARYIITFGFPSATLQPTPSSASRVVNATSSPSFRVSTQPPFTGCGGLLNSTSGTFATPGYPFSYSNNLNCLWTLRIPTDSVLILQLERFNTEQCCDFAELTVSTGRLARLSGSRNGFSTTVRGDRSRVLNIRFTTDRSVVRSGFLARYIVMFGFPSATLQPTPSLASGGMNVTSSPSSQVSTQSPFAGCGGLLDRTSGTFATPGYPFSYSNNLNCLWTLRIPTDSVLILQFERFNTERCCDFVELTVSTGRLATLSGSRNRFNITVGGDRSRVLNIRFTTDGSVVRPGFLARYNIIFVPRPTSFTPFNNVTLPNTAQPPSNTPFVTLPTEVRRVLADLLISLTRIILRLQGLIQGQLTNEAFENFRNDTLQILQQAEMQLERPSNRHLGKRAIHELPDPKELVQIMDEIQRRLLG